MTVSPVSISKTKLLASSEMSDNAGMDVDVSSVFDFKKLRHILVIIETSLSCESVRENSKSYNPPQISVSKKTPKK